MNQTIRYLNSGLNVIPSLIFFNSFFGCWKIIKQKIYFSLILFLLLTGFYACNPAWENYYHNHDIEVDMNLWDAIKSNPEYSSFINLMEEYGFDTLVNDGLSHTIFVPNNEAVARMTADTAARMKSILSHHFTNTIFLTRNVSGQRKIVTYGEKFPFVQESADGYTYDLIPIIYNSPMYLNGLYYEIEEVAIPRPNLYEFTELYSSVIKNYIDQSDSVFLDKSESDPLGFDETGNTIYDSIFGVVNLFERDFFPVSKEFRNKTATFLLCTQDQYNSALDDMAAKLGNEFSSHNDIPKRWQNNVFLPHLMNNSLFENMLEYEDFTDTMINIARDTVYIDPSNINPDSKFLCSNGLTYTYSDFKVPDHLYLLESRLEGESLVDSIGVYSYSWNEEVETWGISVAPVNYIVPSASEGYLVKVDFTSGFEGEWGIKFYFKDVLPMKYSFLWRSTSVPSGKYRISVNGEVLEYTDRYGRKFTEFDTHELSQVIRSVTGGKFIPDNQYNSVDFWVNSITEFGDVEVIFEYIGPGAIDNNGFIMDYVALIPSQQQ